MPRAWSDAVKACRKHPQPVRGRWCSCRTGWRYRMAFPDPVTGIAGSPRWSARFPTKEAADQDQRTVRKAIADKSFVHDRGLTVAAYLEEWLALKRSSGRKASTVAGYAAIIENHLEPQLGKHRLSDLQPHHVQGLVDRLARKTSLRRGKSTNEPVTAGTIANVRAVLRAALGDAVRTQLIQRNVATMVTLPRVRRAQPVALHSDRLTKFLGLAAEDKALGALWVMATVYGMRRAELVGLRWNDIDEEAQRFWVRQTVLDVPGEHLCPYCGRSHTRLRFDTPKSAAGERVYPLVPDVAARLTPHRRLQERERDLYGSSYVDHGLVFAQPDGSPWRPDRVSREFRRLMKASGAAAGLDRPPSLKALRSSLVTALHEAGTPLEVISKVTGHAGGEVTRDHYLAITAERTRPEFDSVAARLVPRTSPSEGAPPTASQKARRTRSDPQSDPQAPAERQRTRRKTMN